MTRYDSYPDHPLHGVPQSILDIVRNEIRTIRDNGDIEITEDMIEPVSDAIVAKLVEADRIRYVPFTNRYCCEN